MGRSFKPVLAWHPARKTPFGIDLRHDRERLDRNKTHTATTARYERGRVARPWSPVGRRRPAELGRGLVLDCARCFSSARNRWADDLVCADVRCLHDPGDAAIGGCRPSRGTNAQSIGDGDMNLARSWDVMGRRQLALWLVAPVSAGVTIAVMIWAPHWARTLETAFLVAAVAGVAWLFAPRVGQWVRGTSRLR